MSEYARVYVVKQDENCFLRPGPDFGTASIGINLLSCFPIVGEPVGKTRRFERSKLSNVRFQVSSNFLCRCLNLGYLVKDFPDHLPNTFLLEHYDPPMERCLG